jgi:glucokinase
MRRVNVGRPHLLKKINRSMVLDLIRGRGRISRADISRELNISKPTVSKVVKELLSEGLIKEAGLADSSGGKPAMLLEYNVQAGYIVGVYVGPSFMIYGLADLGANILRRLRTDLVHGKHAVEVMVHNITMLCQGVCDREQKLLSVGVAVAGLTDPEEGVVRIARHLPGWEGLRLRDALRESLGVPVVIDNDVNMAIVGEHSHGAVQGVNDAVMITVGDAIALGVIIDGKVHRGVHFAAGEIGNMVIDRQQFSRNGEPRSGYLDRLVSWRSLQIDWSGVDDLECDELPKDVFVRALEDRSFAEKLFTQNWTDVGLAIGNVISVLDPEVVVLGGEITRVPPVFVDGIRDVVRKVALFAPTIVVSELGRDAELLGSINTALECVQERVTVTTSL